MSISQIYPEPEDPQGGGTMIPVLERIDFIVVPGLSFAQNFSVTAADREDEPLNSLQDLLSADFPHSRILLFSYHPISRFEDGFTESSLRLLNQVLNRRKEDPFRPIIFIAYGVGGIVVKSALIRAAADSRYWPIKRSTRAIAFFGTPHRASSPNASLESLVSLSLVQQPRRSHPRFIGELGLAAGAANHLSLSWCPTPNRLGGGERTPPRSWLSSPSKVGTSARPVCVGK
ncbi:hypothetical protein B0T25DRAFT_552281 [Lasiosphaeria hispida]|uniref:DUF676 domain-containing protein n=1 Tax=Lasiosphaeria hispida TaxID=260671 RepID=A0AAJ0HBH7_9PEZI|nr:hypothetical protein B0T25DRAFT_552281 [Lasiosphaeria hispida]